MSGNARGKLKEHLEGLHNNFEWARVHCVKAKDILGDTHPELHELFDNIAGVMATMDDIAADIFSKL